MYICIVVHVQAKFIITICVKLFCGVGVGGGGPTDAKGVIL